MAYSYETVTTNGMSAVVPVPFPYLERDHVSIKLAGALVPSTDYAWVNDGEIHLNVVPAAGLERTVRRTTPADEPAVVFSAGNLTSANLNASLLQQLYIVQESFDNGESTRIIAETLAEALETIDTVLTQVIDARDQTLAANVDVQAALAQVIILRDEVQAVVDLAALGVELTPYEFVTSTNVQLGIQDLADYVLTLEGRVADLETLTDGLPATLALKYDKTGGAVSGEASFGAGIKITGSLGNFSTANWGTPVQLNYGHGIQWKKGSGTYSFLMGVSADIWSVVRKATDVLDGSEAPTTIISCSAAGVITTATYGNLGTYISTIASNAAAGALATANANITAGDNARVSQVALGGSWATPTPHSGSSIAPTGGVMTGYINTSDSTTSYGQGKYLYYYLPNSGWVLGGSF